MGRFIEITRKARAAFDRIAVYLLLAAWLLLLIFAALVQFNWYDPGDNPYGYMAVAASLMLLLSEYVTGLYARLMETLSTEGTKLREMQAELEAMKWQATLLTDAVKDRDKLFSIETAANDLTRRLQGLPPGSVIEIEHLGLNLTQAWDNIHDPLDQASRQFQVDYKLLMLGEDKAKSKKLQLPNDVRNWIRSAITQFDKICTDLQAMAAPGAGPGRSLRYEIRTYCELPVVHGFVVRKPFKAGYVAISRWNRRKLHEYDWGAKQFHRIIEPVSNTDQDLLNIFEGHFQRWWTTNPTRVCGGPPPAATPPAGTRA